MTGLPRCPLKNVSGLLAMTYYPMNLSVITVTWNSEKQIARQIRSVEAGCKNISHEQFVVDNNSTDSTVEILEKNFPQIKLLRNKQNIGFAAANNQAARLARGDFFLFLNPDMQVSEGSLNIMLDWMKNHPDVGLASCKLVDEHGYINQDAQPRRFPRVWDQLAIVLKLPHILPHINDRYLFKDFNPEIEQEVDSVRGSFMMMRKEVYERLGWAFDPRYYIWFEDVDLCKEVKRLGFKVMHTPIISCVDYVGQSFKKRSTFWKQRQFIKSMYRYFKKWGI